MDLTYGAEYEDFRSEVRAFLESNWPPRDDASEFPRNNRESHFRRLATEAGYLRSELPRAENGKLYRRRLREEFWQDSGRSI